MARIPAIACGYEDAVVVKRLNHGPVGGHGSIQTGLV
jgi:hypothetical protein